jgi:tetratricopeptide (TPR) repeat protein
MANKKISLKIEDKPCSVKKCFCWGPQYANLNSYQKFFLNGLVLYVANDIDSAIENFNKAIDPDINPSNIFNNLGVLYAYKNEYEKAYKYFKNAHDSNSIYQIYLINYCNILLKLKEREKARTACEEFLYIKDDIEIKELLDNIYNNKEKEFSFKLCTDFIPVSIEEELGINNENIKIYINKENDIRILANDKCNNNCIYCKDLGIKSINFKQKNELISEIKQSTVDKIVLPCNFDIKNDALEILKEIKRYKNEIILESNGRIFMYKSNIINFSKYIDIFQIFLNGDEQTHNVISGTEAYQQTILGLKNLMLEKAKVEVNFILTNKNIDQLYNIINKTIELNLNTLNIIIFNKNNDLILKSIPIIKKITKIKEKLIIKYLSINDKKLK